MCIIINPTMTGIAWDPLLISVDTPVLPLCCASSAVVKEHPLEVHVLTIPAQLMS